MYLEIFWRISRYFVFFWEFRGISRKYLNFTGPRPREISEALARRQRKLRINLGLIDNLNLNLILTLNINKDIFSLPLFYITGQLLLIIEDLEPPS